MINYKFSRIIPAILMLIIVIVAIVFLMSLAKSTLFGNSSESVSQSNADRATLLDTSSTHSVSMTVRGPIIADENFRSYQIKIEPSSRVLIVYKGYQNQLVNEINLSNNISSYEQFVYALNLANLVKGTALNGEKDDMRGICADGVVYDFQILNADKVIKHLWTSSCSESRGSLDANINRLINLFENQIPTADSIVGELWR